MTGTQNSVGNARQGAGECGRRDADDGVRHSRQRHRLANHLGSLAEAIAPQGVTENCDGRHARGAVFVGTEPAAQCQSNAEHIEVVGGHGFARDQHAPLRRRQDAPHIRVAGDALQCVGAASDVLVVWIGRRELWEVLAEPAVDLDQPVGCRDDAVAEEHGVDDAEKRRVEPDAERERSNGGRSE